MTRRMKTHTWGRLIALFLLILGWIGTCLCTLPLLENHTANASNEEIPLVIEVIKPQETQPVVKKRVLIYHTHTYEAYEPTPENSYQATEKWRTEDNSCNIVRVGEELAACLRAVGFEVVHDLTAYEPPDLSTSYSRSLVALENRQAAGEKYDLYIDLHRDAYTEGLVQTVDIGSQHLARIMLLVGKGTGESYLEKPDWETNCVLAQCISDQMNKQVSDLSRGVLIKTGRFNQHIAPCCVLIEIGNNKNTLEEALAAVPYLAQAIAAVFAQ